MAAPPPHLSIRHAPALKPAIKHVINAAEHTLAAAAGDGDVINEVSVEVCDLQDQYDDRSIQK